MGGEFYPGQRNEGEHIMSCPGCWSWQLHWSELAAMGWLAIGPDGLWDSAVFDAMVEDIIREHVASECPSPRLVMELARARGLL